MKTTTITYASRDTASTVRALMWEPDQVASGGEAPRGLVQIVHGMSEHVGRYVGFASFLCEQGFAVCANDHIGHGKTAARSEDLGHMPLEVGEDVLVADVQTLREVALDRLSTQCDMRVDAIPYVIFGHSMGSFVTRVFLTRHAFGVRAAVLCGTGHQPRVLSGAGKAITGSLAKKHGERYVSDLVDSMAAGGYGRSIEDAETELDWLATDPEVVAEYQRDPLCGQKFTVGAYHVLLSLVADATDPRLARRLPHGLPLLFVSGECDPVGEFGAGVHRAAEMYRKVGVECVSEKLYPGMRHEILNEPVKEQVHRDVLTWLERQGL